MTAADQFVRYDFAYISALARNDKSEIVAPFARSISITNPLVAEAFALVAAIHTAPIGNDWQYVLFEGDCMDVSNMENLAWDVSTILLDRNHLLQQLEFWDCGGWIQ